MAVKFKDGHGNVTSRTSATCDHRHRPVWPLGLSRRRRRLRLCELHRHAPTSTCLVSRRAWHGWRVCSCVLPFLQSRGLRWRRTTTSHAACTPFISQAFCDGRMSRPKHIFISPTAITTASQSSHGQPAGASMLKRPITSSSSLAADRPASLRRAG